MITEKKLIQAQTTRATMKVRGRFWKLNTMGSSLAVYQWPLML